MMDNICANQWALICALWEASELNAPISQGLLHYLNVVQLPTVTEDAIRNEFDHYELFFGKLCSSWIDNLFNNLCDSLACESSDNNFQEQALQIMQSIFSRALWKYQLRLNGEIENFTREFDRLDVSTERDRLYLYCRERGHRQLKP